MKTGLIVALDVKSMVHAREVVDELSQSDVIFKVGSILYTLEGNKVIDYIHSKGRKVFLDLKFFDIPNTIRGVSFAASKLGVEMFTIHLLGGREMVKAAINGVEEAASAGSPVKSPVILGVTILTSMDEKSLKNDLNISAPLQDTVISLACLGYDEGLRGFVCSPLETAVLRKKFGCDAVLVTPGVRMAGEEAGDQKRVTTPRKAKLAGSDYIVMGRPIIDSPDRASAVENVLSELA